MHMVSWSKIAKPKARGGLGIQETKGRNLTLAAKLYWRMTRSRGAGWAEVLHKKYQCQRQRKKGRQSRVWAAVEKGKVIFDRGAKWIIGSSSNINL